MGKDKGGKDMNDIMLFVYCFLGAIVIVTVGCLIVLAFTKIREMFTSWY